MSCLESTSWTQLHCGKLSFVPQFRIHRKWLWDEYFGLQLPHIHVSSLWVKLVHKFPVNGNLWSSLVRLWVCNHRNNHVHTDWYVVGYILGKSTIRIIFQTYYQLMKLFPNYPKELFWFWSVFSQVEIQLGLSLEHGCLIIFPFLKLTYPYFFFFSFT